jgi:PAS domain S-box-containing protein
MPSKEKKAGVPAEPSQERFEAILSSISDGVFTVDQDGLIACFNRAAQEMTGYSLEEALGRPCWKILRSNICRDSCALRYTLETGQPVRNLAVEILTKDGRQIPVSISTALLRDKEGKEIGGVETFRDLRPIEELRKKLEQTYTSQDIVAKSKVMSEIMAKLETVASADSTVLITGESGVGKELVARAIHNLSHRANKPFIPVNCGGLPDTLIESELFGYEKGAFTGANKAKPGRFHLAQGGTLFLDEIGDLAPGVQVKLLRVLQEKVYEPLGGVQPVKTDVRILAATHQDLRAMIDQDTFRQDLYYRINVIEINIPPLRERMEDVPYLIKKFLADLVREQAKDVQGLAPRAMARLMAYDYPGNIRELHNIIEHGFVLCPGGLIQTEHLPSSLKPTPTAKPTETALDPEQLERNRIMAALENNQWNRLAAARELGVHKTTLFRKIKRYGIKLPDKDGRSST